FALLVGDGHDGVVERSLHVHHAMGNVLALLLLEGLLLAFFLRRRGAGCCFRHRSSILVAPPNGAKKFMLRAETRSWPPPSSCWPPCPCAVPCGYGRWCGCAGRAPAGCGDGGCRGTTRSR